MKNTLTAKATPWDTITVTTVNGSGVLSIFERGPQTDDDPDGETILDRIDIRLGAPAMRRLARRLIATADWLEA